MTENGSVYRLNPVLHGIGANRERIGCVREVVRDGWKKVCGAWRYLSRLRQISSGVRICSSGSRELVNRLRPKSARTREMARP